MSYGIGNPGLAWDRHKNLAGLNRSMESQPFPLYTNILNGNTNINMPVFNS
jgi:hypothetical protein